MPRSRKKRAWDAAGLLGAVLLATALRWRKNPSACPYGQRFALELPRPFLTRSGLRSMLAPAPGERVLEIGSGTGYYALPVAQWLEPDGALDVLDLQQKMLDHTMRGVRRLGISKIVSTGATRGVFLTRTKASTRPTWSPRSARSPTRRAHSASSAAC